MLCIFFSKFPLKKKKKSVNPLSRYQGWLFANTGVVRQGREVQIINYSHRRDQIEIPVKKYLYIHQAFPLDLLQYRFLIICERIHQKTHSTVLAAQLLHLPFIFDLYRLLNCSIGGRVKKYKTNKKLKIVALENRVRHIYSNIANF